MYSNDFVEKMKIRMIEEKETLQDELAETLPHPVMDAVREDNAEQDETDNVNQDIIEQLKNDIEEINLALVKIKEDRYGICEVGEEEISEERLEVLPWARTCIEHEGQL